MYYFTVIHTYIYLYICLYTCYWLWYMKTKEEERECRTYRWFIVNTTLFFIVAVSFLESRNEKNVEKINTLWGFFFLICKVYILTYDKNWYKMKSYSFYRILFHFIICMNIFFYVYIYFLIIWDKSLEAGENE